MKKTILVCDHCGEEIKRNEDHFHIHRIKAFGEIILKSERYTDAAGDRDNDIINLDLCEDCAYKVIELLEDLRGE